MERPQSILSELLKTQGYSITSQRLTVFNALLDTNPLSITELTLKLKDKLDRASIYRTVDLFERLGVTQKVSLGWKYKIELSDKFQAHHHHLTCLHCHKIIPIHDKQIEDLLDKIALDKAFNAIEHQIEVQGYCQECEERSKISDFQV